MSLYDYECNSCGHIQEEFHGMSEKPVINCEMCGFVCSKLISVGTQFAGVDGTAGMYDFVDRDTTGKPMRFTGKRQWREHLKSKGLTDDIPQGVPKKENLKPMREVKSKEVRRKEYKEAVAIALKEKGILQKSAKYKGDTTMALVNLNAVTNSVPRANGLKNGNANTILTTPNETYGVYSSGYMDGVNAINHGQIFNSSTDYTVAIGQKETGMKPKS